MIINTDGYGDPTKNTPAHIFILADFQDILDNIRNGTLVTGTGKPFPIEWANDDMDQSDPNPWAKIDSSI